MYLAAGLQQDGFEEGSKKEIECPEDNPNDTATLLQYIYTGQLETWALCDEIHDGRAEDLDTLVHWYQLGDGYMLDDMAKTILGMIENRDDSFLAKVLNHSHLAHIKKAGLRGSMPWDAVIRHVAAKIDPYSTNVDQTTMLKDGLRDDVEGAM